MLSRLLSFFFFLFYKGCSPGTRDRQRASFSLGSDVHLRWSKCQQLVCGILDRVKRTKHQAAEILGSSHCEVDIFYLLLFSWISVLTSLPLFPPLPSPSPTYKAHKLLFWFAMTCHNLYQGLGCLDVQLCALPSPHALYGTTGYATSSLVSPT